jgi:RNA polymerase sigma-70 factor (ECF subfamily)
VNALNEKPQPLPVMSSELESLYRQHHEMVVRTAFRITRDMTDAEDVLHTVFVRLMQRPQRLLGDAKPGPYLHRAAVNAALDVLRRRRRCVPLEAVPAGNGAQAPRQLRLVSDRELGERLRAALASLSERAAEVFVLRHVEGYSNREVGRLLGIPWGTVAVIVHRARRRLQRELVSEGRAVA